MPSHGAGADNGYDVVVIGAGPAGEAAAELAGSLGYSVALVERDTVGGTVVTSGGAPTKAFREAALCLSSFEKDKVYGIALATPPELMYPTVRARAREVSERLRQAALERIREGGMHLVRGEAQLDAEQPPRGSRTRAGAASSAPRRAVSSPARKACSNWSSTAAPEFSWAST